MGRNLIMLGMAILIVSLIGLTIVGFMSGITNPIPWLSLVLLAVVIFAHNKIMGRRFLEWKDSYSVGIESIDNDHKKLLHLINNLQTAVYYKTDKMFERQTLDEVIDYTKYHFGREEKFMEENEYPDFEPHKKQHQDMIDKVNRFVKEYEKGEPKAIEALLDYLKAWLINHINGTDQEYSGFLIGKGVK